MFAVAEGERCARAVACALREALAKAGLDSTARLCRIDPQGARILP